MPCALVDAARRDGREEWLARLPELITEIARRWSLEVGEPFQPGGQTAWVASARTATGDDVVLKVGWRHDEAEHEAAGLRLWDGNGTVRWYATEEFADTVALLIERCTPGTPLSSRPESEQDGVVRSLLSRLWCEPPAGHEFRPLQQMCDAWTEQFEAKIATQPSSLDPGVIRDGVRLFRDLPASADRSVLLCTDLHADNVLAASREPWLMIDPKPYVGDPTYDPLQHLLNCDRRLHDDPSGFARDMPDLLELGGDRLCLWLFARCVDASADWPNLGPIGARLAPR